MKTKTRKNWQDIIAGYTFILPNFTGFLVFTSIPVIASLVLAFLSWDILTPAKFVGFNNFITLFKDKDFWYYLYNTVFFMLGIPLSMAFSLFLAILVNQKLKGITIFRTIFFLPVISSMVAIALVWRWIYNPDFGLLNSFLRYFLKQQPQWLSSTLWAKPALMFMGIWNGAGYSMLLYLEALQSIPEDLYEAARIDGASAWQQFRKITWPMLSFVNFFVIVMGVIGGFQAFGVQYVMTGGGPAGSTTTVVYYVYNNAFQWFKMGYASSIAWVLFIFIFGFTLLQWKYGKKAGEYY